MKHRILSCLAIFIFVATFPLQAIEPHPDAQQAVIDAKSDANLNISPFAWGAYSFACSIVALPHAFLGTPEIPIERMIGKSPEYIDIYTQMYQQHAKHRRLRAAAIGCGISSALSSAAWMFIVRSLHISQSDCCGH